jgi:hypothetical protein
MSLPSVPYVQPSDCETGAYIDNDFITGNLPSGRVPSRQSVGTLGLYTLPAFMHLFDSALAEEASGLFVATANSLVTRQ